MSDQEPDKRNDESPSRLTGRQVCNVVGDTLAGPNVRIKDNVIQAIAIAVCVLLGALIGPFVVEDPIGGMFAGGFLGLLLGLLGSGIFLMIFRAVMHLRGRHD